MSHSPTNRPGLIGMAFSVLVVGGALLRVYDIAGQVVADDEMHSLRSLKQYTASHVFTHFFGADISTPMALLQRVIGNQVGLSEVTTRLPVLAAGLAALVVLPARARRHFGAPVALVFAALVAISPQLIYYSRYGRPYMVCIVLVFCAVFSFVRWWSEGGWTSAATYVPAGASAVWFSVAVAPSVLTPIGWAAARTLTRIMREG